MSGTGQSKLLLRQGIVDSGGQAWAGTHDAWLRSQHFDNRLTQATFAVRGRTDLPRVALLPTSGRRERLLPDPGNTTPPRRLPDVSASS